MKGEKIDLIKETLQVLIELMKENDRISLISFNKNAKQLTQLLKVEENKDILKTTINNIEIGYGTNILSGL